MSGLASETAGHRRPQEQLPSCKENLVQPATALQKARPGKLSQRQEEEGSEGQLGGGVQKGHRWGDGWAGGIEAPLRRPQCKWATKHPDFGPVMWALQQL